MRRTAVIVSTLLLVLPLFGACGDDEENGEGGSGDAATSIEATATEYKFEDLPKEVEAGNVEVTLKNEGKEMHELALIKINGSQTLEEVRAGMIPVVAEEGAPIPEFIDAAGGPTEIEPGEELTTTVTLPEGRYAVLCFVDEGSVPDEEGGEGEGEEGGEEAPSEGASEEGQGEAEEEEPATPHSELGMATELTVVAGDKVNLDDLGGDETIVAKEYGFEVPDLKAGEHTLNFRNDGPAQIHHGILMKFADGTKPDAIPGILEQVFGSEEEPTGPPPFEEAGGSSVFSPGFGGTFEVELEEGTYAFLCFIQDRQGGPPHAIGKKMISPFEVT